MKSTLIFFQFLICLLCACNNDDTPSQYPRTLVFNHSNITSEKGFVIGDNELYTEIDSKSGNLDTLRTDVAFDLFGYIRKLGYGTYIESIVMLSKDSIQLNVWNNGKTESIRLPANIESVSGEIIDKNLLGYTILWDNVNRELKYCFTLSLGILERKGISAPEIGYDFCLTNDVNTELQNVLANSIYFKNDTLGVYLLDMIYK